MSTIEEIINKDAVRISAKASRAESIVSRFLRFICSVRLGVALLILLGLACLIGMLIMQQNVDGFDRYFAQLTPAQRLVYGKLGLFDIYHAWYFNALLCLVSLNIILASIDRFPKTWRFISKPSLTVPVRWLRDQKQTAELRLKGSLGEIADEVVASLKKVGWRKVVVSENRGQTFVFGQSGIWNRFGAYAVHVGLLTIFTGGFMTAQFGSTGSMALTPGESTNLMSETVVDLDRASQITKRLPFDVVCTDMQQKLIKKDGSLGAQNTIDWITRFTIADETGTHEGMVQMNRPFDYRGYRFFQSSFTPIGRARTVTIQAKPANGGSVEEVTIPRDGSAILASGAKVDFTEFRGNFRIGEEDRDEDTSDYANPAAILSVTQAGSTAQTAYAFGSQMSGMPVASKAVGGYTFELAEFEKVADQHILSVQRDPGSNVVYVGFIILFITLVGVFFFSHQRVWAAIGAEADGACQITLGGNTNRGGNSFEEKFNQLVKKLRAKSL